MPKISLIVLRTLALGVVASGFMATAAADGPAPVESSSTEVRALTFEEARARVLTSGGGCVGGFFDVVTRVHLMPGTPPHIGLQTFQMPGNGPWLTIGPLQREPSATELHGLMGVSVCVPNHAVS